MTPACEVEKIWPFFKQQEYSGPALWGSSNYDLSRCESVRSSVHLLLTFHLIMYWYKVLISFLALRSHYNYKKTKLNEENRIKKSSDS